MGESVVYAVDRRRRSSPRCRPSTPAWSSSTPSVADVSDSLDDPVEVLFGVQLGGGTDIARAVAYAAGLVEQPEKTIFLLITDLYEGGNRSALLRAAGGAAREPGERPLRPGAERRRAWPRSTATWPARCAPSTSPPSPPRQGGWWRRSNWRSGTIREDLMPGARFDANAYPSLLQLIERLRELSGDAAHRAGRDYLRGTSLTQGAVAGSMASAVVIGSHRIPRHPQLRGRSGPVMHLPGQPTQSVLQARCRHLPRPHRATRTVQPRRARPAPAPTEAHPPPKRRGQRPIAPGRHAGRTAGRWSGHDRSPPGRTCRRRVGRAWPGGLGPPLRRGRDRRRLEAPPPWPVAQPLQRMAGDDPDPERFAEILQEIWIVRRALAAQADGTAVLEPWLTEELLGKTWRDKDLERVSGLNLLPLADTHSDSTTATSASTPATSSTCAAATWSASESSLPWQSGRRAKRRAATGSRSRTLGFIPAFPRAGSSSSTPARFPPTRKTSPGSCPSRTMRFPNCTSA